MRWDDSLTDFLNLLVGSYPDPASARDVAEKAGLPTRFITFSGNLDNVWMSILREARKSKTGLQEIARVAQRDYPNIDFPNLARQIDAGTVTGPRLEDPDWRGPPGVDGTIEKVM